jgi:hypothetical protein
MELTFKRFLIPSLPSALEDIALWKGDITNPKYKLSIGAWID